MKWTVRKDWRMTYKGYCPVYVPKSLTTGYTRFFFSREKAQRRADALNRRDCPSHD